MKHFIMSLVQRALDSCSIPPRHRITVEEQIRYELDFSLKGDIDEPEGHD